MENPMPEIVLRQKSPEQPRDCISRILSDYLGGEKCTRVSLFEAVIDDIKVSCCDNPECIENAKRLARNIFAMRPTNTKGYYGQEDDDEDMKRELIPY